MIPFNKPYYDDEMLKFVELSFRSGKFCGDGSFTHEVSKRLEQLLQIKKVLLTTSCTHSLEMAAILAEIKPGDEVIVPSYTFVSTVNAFVLRGAKIVFVDIRPDTMNINENLIERAVTKKTKAIVPVHYAGVSCEMNMVMELSKKYNLIVIEDAAQGVMSKYENRNLGTIGHLGCFSFHETKNYHCGEGGALLINSDQFKDRAEIIREKGTNRSRFLRGQVDKYTWVDIGSSYLLNDFSAAALLSQFNKAVEINDNRLDSWKYYYSLLKPLVDSGVLELPYVPNNCMANGHMFYIKLRNLEKRTSLIEFLKKHGVSSAFHYVPLHSTDMGTKFGYFSGEDKYTTSESERLLRLPMYYSLSREEVEKVVECIYSWAKLN